MNYSPLHSLARSHSSRVRGFTLIELTVAVAIFSVAILIVTSALLGVVDASRKAQSVRAAIDSVGTSVDSMSRLMRIGTNYHCGCLGSGGALIECGTATVTTQEKLSENKDCPPASGGGDYIAFEGAAGSRVKFDDQIVFRRGQWPSGYGKIERSDDGGENFYTVTGENTNVTELSFYVVGTQPDNSQPSVMIDMKTESNTGGVPTILAVQTSVTQRTPNLSKGSAFGFSTGNIILSGAENNDVGNCKDGVDNDNDSLVDCDDFSAGPGEDFYNLCAYAPICTNEDCADGIDNDDDGTTDCGDNTCQNFPSNRDKCKEIDVGLGNACRDGVDSNDHCCGPVGTLVVGGCSNPGPGETGYACSVDADCRSKQCTSGGVCSGCGWDSSQYRDNANGTCEADYIWCGKYRDLLPAGETCGGIENCSDGEDNNGNGYIDCTDYAFCNNEICSETGEECTNDIDDDNDGLKNCADVLSCCSVDECKGVGKCATVVRGTYCTINEQCGGGDCVNNACTGFVGEG